MTRVSLGFLTAIAVMIVLESPASAQSPEIDVMLDRIAGTLEVSSMPYMKEGRLSGCQLVFDAMVRDYSYRQGRFIKVSGAVGIMHSGGVPTPPLEVSSKSSSARLARRTGPYRLPRLLRAGLASLVPTTPQI